MKIKYNVGDEVWVMYENKPILLEIEEIILRKKEVLYSFKIKSSEFGYTYKIFEEKNVFLTKRKLLNSFLTEEDKL